MTDKEMDKLIEQNIYETVSNVVDIRRLLEKSEKTKKHLKAYLEFEEEYSKSITYDKSSEFFDMMTGYETSISVGAFLVGFQTGAKLFKLIEDKDFLSKTLEKIM